MREFKKPDVKAPRAKFHSTTILVPKFYRAFRRKHPQYNDYSNEQLGEIIKTYNEALWNTVIMNRDGAEFPEGLGYSFIGCCRPAMKENVDYATSNTVDRRVTHKNLNSDSYLAKIFYTNFPSKYRFPFKDVWAFKGCRNFTRSVSKQFKEQWMNYLQVDNFMKISELYNKKANRIKAQENNIVPDSYNEFAFD